MFYNIIKRLTNVVFPLHIFMDLSVCNVTSLLTGSQGQRLSLPIHLSAWR